MRGKKKQKTRGWCSHALSTEGGQCVSYNVATRSGGQWSLIPSSSLLCANCLRFSGSHRAFGPGTISALTLVSGFSLSCNDFTSIIFVAFAFLGATARRLWDEKSVKLELPYKTRVAVNSCGKLRDCECRRRRRRLDWAQPSQWPCRKILT